MYIWLRGQWMKRLHILIDDDLYDKLKNTAAQRSESVAEVVRKMLREKIDKPAMGGDAPTLTSAEIHELLRVMDAQEQAVEAEKKDPDS
jgi:predicted CopG family antitoxin